MKRRQSGGGVPAQMVGVVRAHRALAAGAGVLVAALLVFVLVWFQPQKLLIEKTVNETLPPAAPTAAGSSSPAVSAGPRVLASGPFRSLEHPTTGTASVEELPGGTLVLRLESLHTSNGPDLRVFLSKRPANLGWRDYGAEYLELGKLKGNIGNQIYEIPAGTDLSQFRSAVIWCARFKVGFGVAALDRA